eukprot:TRINITY_DN13071_c0_g1_i2.p4 TRINITY_DN13071_c0_g1~~TRINITY_DN13071_c0_g1_i2.p4  ORF type:complete len:138 (+),score=46.13 TRINITY_DN13071_c0_g1_i2:58-471(+)
MALRHRGVYVPDPDEGEQMHELVARAADARVAAEAQQLDKEVQVHWLTDVAAALLVFAAAGWLLYSIIDFHRCASRGCEDAGAIRNPMDIPVRPLRAAACSLFSPQTATVVSCGATLSLPLFLGAVVGSLWWSSIVG